MSVTRNLNYELWLVKMIDGHGQRKDSRLNDNWMITLHIPNTCTHSRSHWKKIEHLIHWGWPENLHDSCSFGDWGVGKPYALVASRHRSRSHTPQRTLNHSNPVTTTIIFAAGLVILGGRPVPSANISSPMPNMCSNLLLVNCIWACFFSRVLISLLMITISIFNCFLFEHCWWSFDNRTAHHQVVAFNGRLWNWLYFGRTIQCTANGNRSGHSVVALR